jgi:hypothetical protein
VRGNSIIRHIIDGHPVLVYRNPQLDDSDAHAKELIAKNGGVLLRGGSISLQSESHPIDFRKVEIMLLDDQAK